MSRKRPTPRMSPPGSEDAVHESAPTAVLYVRVSTKEQAERDGDPEGYSIPAQREACQRKATSLGAIVIDEFVDRGESAKTADRPELQRLLELVRNTPPTFVIVHKIDRLARNRADDVEINLEFKKAGVQLVSVTENIDDTPSGILLHGIMSSIAEFYSRNLANEVIKGSVQKAKSGGTPSKAPIGYLNVRRIENGQESRTVEIDPERGPLMQWAFEEYSNGEWTLRKLLAEVTDRGLTSTGGPNTPSKPLGLSHFHGLLRHPYYIGIVRYKGVLYEGRHEPLVSQETWDRVQTLLAANNFAGENSVITRTTSKVPSTAESAEVASSFATPRVTQVPCTPTSSAWDDNNAERRALREQFASTRPKTRSPHTTEQSVSVRIRPPKLGATSKKSWRSFASSTSGKRSFRTLASANSKTRARNCSMPTTPMPYLSAFSRKNRGASRRRLPPPRGDFC